MGPAEHTGVEAQVALVANDVGRDGAEGETALGSQSSTVQVLGHQRRHVDVAQRHLVGVQPNQTSSWTSTLGSVARLRLLRVPVEKVTGQRWKLVRNWKLERDRPRTSCQNGRGGGPWCRARSCAVRAWPSTSWPDCAAGRSAVRGPAPVAASETWP